MFLWKKWRNPIAVFAVTAMLGLAAYGAIEASGDLSDAAGGQVQISQWAVAASDVELAWNEAVGADALAATGQAPAESQASFDAAIARYNSGKAILSTTGIEQVDLALAGTDQGLAALTASFNGTLALAASGDVAAATGNHMANTLAVFTGVQPAVQGLGQVSQAATVRLEGRMDSGASSLQLLGWISAAVVAIGAAFTGWSVWSIYRKDEEEAEASTVSTEPSASWEQAA